MKDRLRLDRCVLFRSTCFRKCLDLTYVENEEGLIHYMLQKQKVSDNDHYDLPLVYNINGHTLHFGHHEFCLITGCKFGLLNFLMYREGDISFHDRVFQEKIREYVKNIDLLSMIEDEERFTKLSDEDSIRVCLLLSVEVIFMGHELGSIVDDVFLRMVDNLETWNDFPWGKHIWRELYAAIRNVNSKHKDVHHKALEINPNFVLSYSLPGFVLCFKIWILESSSVTDRWWSKLSEAILRGCFCSKHLLFQKWEYFWEKDREIRPGTQSSSKEVSLHNRVKALEGLCDSLMILPKEIKSLKAPVYKLETIIHVIIRKTKGINKKHKDKVKSVEVPPSTITTSPCSAPSLSAKQIHQLLNPLKSSKNSNNAHAHMKVDIGEFILRDMAEVVMGKPFRKVTKLEYDCAKGLMSFTRIFDNYTFQMLRTIPRNAYEKNKFMYKNCLNLGPEYQVDESMKEWLIHGHVIFDEKKLENS
ncbi:phospholipase-like, aminotransferase-like mobile domain protein [Tanacetum coccineum]